MTAPRPFHLLPPDLRIGLRLMARQPVLTLTAVVSLMVGIGLATVGFSFMDTVLFSRLPFHGGDRFVLLRVFEEPQHAPARLTPESYAALAAGATTLEHLGALISRRENATLPSGDVAVVATAGLTPASLRDLPWAPVLGRPLEPADGAPGAPPVAVIRERFRERAFAGGADPLGAKIEVGGVARTIVGVVPDAFEFPNTPDILWPVGDAFLAGRGRPEPDVRLFGVLATGQSRRAAQRQLAAIAPSLAVDGRPDAPVRLQVTTFTDLGPQGTVLAAAVVGLVAAVLLIVAANVGNLVLARSMARAHEFAVRSALGASRRRLVAQVFVEVLLLAGTSAAAGTQAASAVMRRFNGMEELPFWVDFTPGPRALLLAAGATLGAAAVASVWPALRATRRDLAAHLQSGDRAGDVRFGRIAGALVVLQIAVSVVMLHGAAIFVQGLTDYAAAPPDVPRDVLATSLSLDTPGISVTADDVESVAAAVPGVMAAGLSTALPRNSPRPLPVEIETVGGAMKAAPELAPSAEVSRGFFAALDARALRGRLFVPADYRPDAARVAVVNEPFVWKFLGGAPPIGRRFRTVGPAGPGPWREIVGVVPDLGLSVGDPSLAAGYYVPLDPKTGFVYLAVRTSGDPLPYAMPLRRALLARAPRLVLNRVERLEDVAHEDMAAFKGFSAALAGIGAVTLILALTGVYAMMALIVTRRTREIGIRVALGASGPRVVGAIVGRAAWQVGFGGALGAGLAVASLAARNIFMSRLGTGGPWTLPLVVSLLVLAGLAATWLPLRRALRVRPAEALRVE